MPKKVLIGLIAINLVIIIVGVVYSLISYQKIVVKPKNTKPANTIPAATPTPDPNQPISVLLLGYGGGKHDGGRLTDSIMVVRLFPRERKVDLISIPRDLWVELPLTQTSTKGYKINAAYAIGSDDKNYPDKPIEFTGKAGGGQMAKFVISQVLGFNIDYFISLDFSGFSKIIDILGGVDVTVSKSFEDPLYPVEGMETDVCGLSPEEIIARTATLSGAKLEESFACRYEVLKFEKGVTHMDGNTALKFVRSRHSKEDGGDFNRASRQKNLIEAVKNKVLSLNFVPKIIPTVTTLSSHLQTDINIKTMEQLIDRISEFSTFSINSIALTDDNVLENARSDDGQSVLMPRLGFGKYNDIQHFIQTGVAPTSTPKITPTD